MVVEDWIDLVTICNKLPVGHSYYITQREMIKACAMFLSSSLYDTVRTTDVKERLVPYIETNFDIICSYDIVKDVWLLHKKQTQK